MLVTDWDDTNRSVIEEFRRSGGTVSGPLADFPLALVTHSGAKTGTQRVNPLVYTRRDGDGDDLVVAASLGGAPNNPQWYHNLKANPQATVEVGDETYDAEAVEVFGRERDELFDAHARQQPQFRDYAAKTTRTIPVIVFKRQPPRTNPAGDTLPAASTPRVLTSGDDGSPARIH